ncbi:hypothetical protein V2O64_11735 [Verrucomicrobiaceae bacterium 227]
MPEAPKKRKHGCLRTLLIVLLVFTAIKGCSAFVNRPSALYQKWLGTPVPEDVTELRGNFTFQLTESVAWLSFKAPPDRIAQIVQDRGLAPSLESWLTPIKTLPADQVIYWVPNHPGDQSRFGGWALYYSPSTQEAYFTLHTI